MAIAAAISPYDETRQYNRKEIGDYVEVFCKCPLDVLIERDSKGMYKRAISGEIPNFTGISDPYEEPTKPDLVLHTDREKPEQSAARVLQRLEELAYIPYQFGEKDAELQQMEEQMIRKQLEELGYI